MSVPVPVNTTSDVKDISEAREIYRFSQSFQEQMGLLEKDYSSYRESRGDGNCYYRSVGTTYIEHLCRAGTPIEEFHDFLMRFDSDPNFRLILGKDLDYRQMGLFEALAYLADFKQRYSPQEVRRQLDIYLKHQPFDLAIVKLMRTIAANFLMNNRNHPEIEPLFEVLSEYTYDMMVSMGTEAEGLTFYCIAEGLGLCIKHVILNNKEPYSTQVYKPRRRGRFPCIYIWFRTGHYDILYSPAQHKLERNEGLSEAERESLYYSVGIFNMRDVALSYFRFASKLLSEYEVQDSSPEVKESSTCILQNLTNLYTAANIAPPLANFPAQDKSFLVETQEFLLKNRMETCQGCRKDFVSSLDYCKHLCMKCIIFASADQKVQVCPVCRQEICLELFSRVIRECKRCKNLKGYSFANYRNGEIIYCHDCS
mmetsp:Transcript_32344/g.55994  ORF Transcript_32344/g.55994 Transcript_32344/m.55994 type:complete len:425 (+) Transcript_32344:3565-4839(+)